MSNQRLYARFIVLPSLIYCNPQDISLLQEPANNPKQELQGVEPIVTLGFDNPAIMKLLNKYTNVFANPVFPPSNHLTHDIGIVDNTFKPLKPKPYFLSPDQQAEVKKQLDIYLEKGLV